MEACLDEGNKEEEIKKMALFVLKRVIGRKKVIIGVLTSQQERRWRKALLLLASQLPFLSGFEIAWCFVVDKLLPCLFSELSKMRANLRVLKTRSCFLSCQNSELISELPKLRANFRAAKTKGYFPSCQKRELILELPNFALFLGAVKFNTFFEGCRNQSFLIGQLFTLCFLRAVKKGIFFLGSQLPTFSKGLSKLRFFSGAVKLELFSEGNHLPYVFSSLSKRRFFEGVNFYPHFFGVRQKSGLFPNYSKWVATGLYWASLCRVPR